MREVEHGVVPEIALRRDLYALIAHRVTTQHFLDLVLDTCVDLRAENFGQGVAIDLFGAQAKDIFIGLVVKAESLLKIQVGNQGRHVVSDLAQLHFAGTQGIVDALALGDVADAADKLTAPP